MLPVLLSFLAIPSAAAAAAPDLDARLALWDEGAALLDEGRCARAAAHFARLLREGRGGLEAAEGFFRACERLCRADSALAWLAGPAAAGAAVAPARERFLEALRQRRAFDHVEAARGYARAAELSAAAGDTLSAVVARLEAARSLLREEKLEGVDLACAAAGSLLAGREERGGAARLLTETRILRAGIHNLAGELAPADSLYREILGRAGAHGWRQVRCDALNGIGASLSTRRRTREALDRYREALAEARRLDDPYRIALFLTNLAYEETQVRELDRAAALLEEALGIAEGCGHAQLLGLVYNGLGAVADTRGDRPAAAAHFRRSCEHSVRAGYERGELGARQRLAFDLLQMGEYREAATHYARCLEILEAMQSTYILNWVLAGMALANHYLGDLEGAELYYRRALDVNERLGDRMSAAWCLNSIGLVHALRGDYRQALVHHHRAREIYEAIGDPEGLGEAHASIAEVLLRLGDLDQARAHGELALARAEESGAEELLRTAAGVLAEVYGAAGRSDLAERHQRQALEIARRWRDNIATIWALDELAAQLLAQGRRDEARALLDEASGRLAERGEYPVRARTLLLLSRSEDDPGRAAGFAARALAVAREGCLPETEWQCLSELGVHALALGDTVRAETCQRDALAVIESLRREVGVDELRRHMLRPALRPYERLIDLLLARGRSGAAAARALAVSERSRAQLLASRLRAAGARPGGVDPAAGRAEQDLLARLGHLQARLQDGALPAEERRGLRLRIDELEQEFRMLRLSRAENDGGAATAYYPEVEPPDTLLAALRPGERLLSWFLGEPTSCLFSAAGGRVRAHPLPPRDEIEAKVRYFLQLREGESATQLPPEVLAAAARELHDLLLGGAAAELQPGETLVLVPDGLLHRLPFALLRGARGNLIEEHELFLAPSLRTLRYLRARDRARRSEGDPPALPLLAVGCEGGGPAATGAGPTGSEGESGARGADPVPAGPARVLPFTGAAVPHLPHAAAEAAEVAALFPGARLLTGGAAGEASFKHSPLRDAEILHVAAHGHADAADVRRSFLVLNAAVQTLPASAGGSGATGGAGDPPPEDGLLQWHEAVALPLDGASLVTLAACRSAGGVLAHGEGITGLTQAFLHAGATSVLAAQADVPDRLARRLMLGFYRELREGRTAAAALRAAQREAMAWQDDAGVPAAWAGFVLVGDGAVTLAPRGGLRLGLPAAGALAALLGAGLAVSLHVARRRRKSPVPRERSA